MMTPQATAEVVLAAFMAVHRREQEAFWDELPATGGVRRVPEDIADRLAIEEERGKPPRPLRDHVAERERRERGGLKAAR